MIFVQSDKKLGFISPYLPSYFMIIPTHTITTDNVIYSYVRHSHTSLCYLNSQLWKLRLAG